MQLFSDLRACHGALAALESIEAVVALLRDRSTESLATREEVVRALLSDVQTTHSRLASTILALGFRPMIRALARRLRHLGEDEAVQGALVAFLDSVAVVRPGPRTIIRLYWVVRDRVLADRRRDDKWSTSREHFNENEWPVEGGAAVEELIDCARLARRAAKVAPREGERLADYAARVRRPSNGGERAALRAAVKHQRCRVLAELRSQVFQFAVL